MVKSKKDEKKGKKGSSPSETLSQIKSLIAQLHSKDGIVRQEARRGLEFIGKQAACHIIPLLKDPEEDVRWEAAKALAEIVDVRAASQLVATLDDSNFGVRWLAEEGLIAIGRDALPPLMKALTKHSDSAWLREGAHHVLRGLVEKDLAMEGLLAPVIAALEGAEPEIGVVEPAYAALEEMKALRKGQASGVKR